MKSHACVQYFSAEHDCENFLTNYFALFRIAERELKKYLIMLSSATIQLA